MKETLLGPGRWHALLIVCQILRHAIFPVGVIDFKRNVDPAVSYENKSHHR